MSPQEPQSFSKNYNQRVYHREPGFENTKNQIPVQERYSGNKSPQKMMNVPEFNDPDSFKQIQVNEPPQKEKKFLKVSHLDQFFKNKQSINNQFYKTPSNPTSNKIIKEPDFVAYNNNRRFEDDRSEKNYYNNNNNAGMWEDQNNGDFTEEDFKKLEQKALPKGYMGNDNNDNLKFY